MIYCPVPDLQRQTDRQKYINKDRQADRQIKRDRHADRETDTHKDRQSRTCVQIADRETDCQQRQTETYPALERRRSIAELLWSEFSSAEEY